MILKEFKVTALQNVTSQYQVCFGTTLSNRLYDDYFVYCELSAAYVMF